MKANKKKKKVFKLGNIIFIIIFFALLVFFSYNIGNFYFQNRSKQIEKKQLEEELSNQQTEGKRLVKDVEKLNDNDYIARYLREKYFYSKEGDYIIRIIEDEEGN